MKHKKTIIVAGGGFAGLEACRYLYRNRRYLNEYNLILIDKKKTFDFLPLAPDVIAGWLNPKAAKLDLANFTQKLGIEFINEEIEEIDPAENILRLTGSQLIYDYAIIAVGSQVNFYGRHDLEAKCLKLNTIDDAVTIKNAIAQRNKKRQHTNIVVTGGGYTGLEVATNAHYLLSRKKLDFNILVVENRDSILTGLPERLVKIARSELNTRKIQVILKDTVTDYQNQTITLSSGRKIDDAICVWSAGVWAPQFLQKLDAEKIKGRVKVDQHLNIVGKEHGNLFFAGDCCSFSDKKTGQPLRMAVVFSLEQAKTAAKNILNLIRGKEIEEYQPRDPGYLVPLTYLKAPGIVLGRKVGSRLGFFLHYCLCVYRSNISKKLLILKDLIFRRFLKL